ncbi:HNH endonuclease [Paracoccus sp. (in: a-proteobacteria)]|uniref:HNH endonuclease n=1 Tax=Paracoccus sp. TaxID=267 RepID=UPI0028B17559|nr:HNH endonuclease [Paracoccus sp. (in: a-proteobacteria)]
MADKQLHSPEALHQLLRYDPETGQLFWRERGPEWFSDGAGRYTANRAARIWNTKYAGKPALYGVDSGHGYRKGSIVGSNVYAHRAIWAMQTGTWPSEDIDHINGDRSDNRWVNLRSVSRRVNAKNARRRSTNTSGMMGVEQYGAHGRWRARIMVDGRTHHIGCFDSYEAACSARLSAEAAMGFHPNHGRA